MYNIKTIIERINIMNKEEKKEHVSIIMSKELHTKLANYAEKKDMSRSSVLRTGFKLLLEKEGGE